MFFLDPTAVSIDYEIKGWNVYVYYDYVNDNFYTYEDGLPKLEDIIKEKGLMLEYVALWKGEQKELKYLGD